MATKLINLNTSSIKKAVKTFTGLTARVHKVRGQQGIRIVVDGITAEGKEKMQKFFAEFNIVSCLFGKTYTPQCCAYSYERLFAIGKAEEVVETPTPIIEAKQKDNSVEAFWAGSVSQSVLNDVKKGNYTVIGLR